MDKDLWMDKSRIVNERRRQNEERSKLASKQQLKKDVKKKITTTMIGALDDIEKIFGYLWGIDKQEKDLTEEEIYFRDLFLEIRSSILDRGHIQINAIIDELDNYDVNWNRYRYNCIIKKDYGV